MIHIHIRLADNLGSLYYNFLQLLGCNCISRFLSGCYYRYKEHQKC